MKRLISTIVRKLPPIKLYLEDLEYLDSQLRSIPANVTIFTDEYEFENVEELSKTVKEKVVRKLNIQAITTDGFTIGLVVAEDSAHLSLVGANDAKARGVFEQLLTYLRERRNSVIMLIVRSAWPIVLLLTSVTIYSGVQHQGHVSPTLLISWIIICLVCLIVATAINDRSYTTIYLKHRADAPSFWERNWEKILIAVVNLIIGIVLGWLARFLPGPK